MAKDFVGKELKVDDEVVFMQRGYRSLVKGKIIKVTDKMCVVEHGRQNIGGTEAKQFHNQVIKIEA